MSRVLCICASSQTMMSSMNAIVAPIAMRQAMVMPADRTAPENTAADGSVPSAAAATPATATDGSPIPALATPPRNLLEIWSRSQIV